MSDDLETQVKIFQTIFEGLDKETLQKLQSVARQRDYEPETVLCQQGRVEHTFYVVVKGEVIVTQTLKDGEKRILGICGPSQYFGEMGLLDNTPRIATCTTLSPTTVLEITEEMFDDLVEKDPAIAYALMYRLLENLRANDALAIEELLTKNQELSRAYAELQEAQLALVKKERLERELEIIAEVQQSLLPTDLPEYSDYQFASYLQLARRAGGDFYDVIHLDDEHVGILLGDVADKGIHASLFMAVTRTLFLAESRRSLSPADVTRAVHRGMLDVSATNDMFVMAFYGILHRPTGTLTYVIAGQQRPLLVRPDQSVRPLDGFGSFLGMLDDIQIGEYRTQLQPGDHLVLFSNGVIDATNQAGQQYGKQRLQSVVADDELRSAEAVLQAVVADLVLWREGASPLDDLALLVVSAL